MKKWIIKKLIKWGIVKANLSTGRCSICSVKMTVLHSIVSDKKVHRLYCRNGHPNSIQLS
jgi:hypothetical protein